MLKENFHAKLTTILLKSRKAFKKKLKQNKRDHLNMLKKHSKIKLT